MLAGLPLELLEEEPTTRFGQKHYRRVGKEVVRGNYSYIENLLV